MEADKMNGLKYIRSQIINKTMDELATKLDDLYSKIINSNPMISGSGV